MTGADEAGVVDEHVDAAPALEHVRDRRPQGGAVGDVAGHRHRLAAFGLDQRRGAVERAGQRRGVGPLDRRRVLALLALVDGAGCQRDVVARPGQVHRDGLADAPAGAGDERDSSSVGHEFSLSDSWNGDGVGVDTRSQQRTGLRAGEHTPLDDGLAAHDDLLDRRPRRRTAGSAPPGRSWRSSAGSLATVSGSKSTRSACAPSAMTPPVAQAEQLGGHTGHLAHALFEREQTRAGAPARRARPTGSWRGT